MMQILDCTLRDGANVVGKGFSAELTRMMLEGLIENNIKIIEMGNALGLGAYEQDRSIAPLTDAEYLELLQPYLNRAEIGMFIGYKNVSEKYCEVAAKAGLKFLRIGANAGDGALTREGICTVKRAGLKCRYSIMKAYILPPQELLTEMLLLQESGVDEVTIMDSAGTMLPNEVREYARVLSNGLKIPVGFHGHNNLGLSVANALAALEGGASVLDAGLLGMARSAGNCATELLVAALQRLGLRKDVNLYGLLDFLDNQLIPAMRKESDYHTAVTPNDLVYGFAGCHSSFSGKLESIAREERVSLYELIVEVSKIDRKAPSTGLMKQVAEELNGK